MNATAAHLDEPPSRSPLLEAARRVLRPLARLLLARGVSYPTLEELLKSVLVEAASDGRSGAAARGTVSRVSAATGLHRRDVARLLEQDAPRPVTRVAPVIELFARWSADPALRDADGRLLALPRVGAAPSFEALAQSVTQNVHPRSLLDELVRLNLAELDTTQDEVRLKADAFVPRGDTERMLDFLGANVGDHLDAAVTNVLGDGRRHFEQAIFANHLSEESLAEFRRLVSEQWQRMQSQMVPVLERLIAEDRGAGRRRDRRVRIGLYTFTDTSSDPAGAPAAEPADEGRGPPLPRRLPRRVPRGSSNPVARSSATRRTS